MSWWPVRAAWNMVLFILVHFAALCSVVFTHKDSLDKGSIQTSFELRDVERSDGSGIVSSFQKTLRCVNSEPSNLKIAAFNVRTFGTKKMSTPGVPEVLVKVRSAVYFRWVWRFKSQEKSIVVTHIFCCVSTANLATWVKPWSVFWRNLLWEKLRETTVRFLSLMCLCGRYRQLEFNLKFWLWEGDDCYLTVHSLTSLQTGLLGRIGLI